MDLIMAREIQVLDSASSIAEAGALHFVRICNSSVKANGKFSVVLSGGSTPKGMLSLLASDEYKKQVPWDKCHFFWGDERSVPPTHADSNFKMATDALLSHIPANPAQIYRMEAEKADINQAAQEYQNKIATFFNIPNSGSPPQFDLLYLGMGPDGHTASLFPGTTALGEKSRWVVPNFVPKFNTNRMTFTYPMINQAKNIIFLVAGKDKVSALKEVLQGEPALETYPSQGINPIHGSLLWLLDADSSAELS
jgi:6-phosphogluconolactonase